MKLKLVIFLIIVVLIVGTLIYIEMGRQNPWDSDVFFGFNSEPELMLDETDKPALT